jgi:hypothetical protein
MLIQSTTVATTQPNTKLHARARNETTFFLFAIHCVVHGVQGTLMSMMMKLEEMIIMKVEEMMIMVIQLLHVLRLANYRRELAAAVRGRARRGALDCSSAVLLLLEDLHHAQQAAVDGELLLQLVHGLLHVALRQLKVTCKQNQARSK